MNRILSAAFFVSPPVVGTLSLLGQTVGVGIEQQLRSQYRIASVGNNGVMVRAKTTATIQGNNLTDSGGQVWVLGDQPARSAAGDAVLQNQDVIKLVKAALDDALIVAKIGSSKCQFNTSTDSLIQLKQSGVSAGVLKAAVAAGK